MSDLEKLTEKATIEFARPLDLKQAEEMLKKISEEMNADVRYTAKYFNAFNAGKEDRGSFEIDGTIIILQQGRSESFSLKPEDVEDECKFLKMQFDLTHSDHEDEYFPETFQLWDETRAAVNKYFKENPKLFYLT